MRFVLATPGDQVQFFAMWARDVKAEALVGQQGAVFDQAEPFGFRGAADDHLRECGSFGTLGGERVGVAFLFHVAVKGICLVDVADVDRDAAVVFCGLPAFEVQGAANEILLAEGVVPVA